LITKLKRPISDVFAVMVTHFPEAGFGKRLAAISGQVAKLIVVDNGTVGDKLNKLRVSIAKTDNANLILNNENIGIGAALNIGIKEAIIAGAKAVITFDQDSTPDPLLIKRLIETETAYPDPARLMAIGSNIQLQSNGQNEPIPDLTQPQWQHCDDMVTSGTFYKTEVFSRVGLFDDRLFIDLVDREFCLRIKKANYRMVIANHALLYHQLGKMTSHSFLNLRVHPTNHAPERRYYQFRNSILLYKIHHDQHPQWCQNNLILLLKTLIMIFVYENHKFKKIRSIALGVLHGLKRRAGRNGEIRYAAVSNQK
jgi:rhamnosyltransferase